MNDNTLLAEIDIDNVADYLTGLSDKELSEMVELTDSLRTQFDTKFHIYNPAPIAEYFHTSTAKTRAAFGGNRSSKTFSHMMDFGIQFTGEEPIALKGMIPEHRLDPTRRLRMCMGDYPNSFIKVVWPYVQQLIPHQYIHEVVRESGRIKAITNRFGGFIEFMQYDQDVEKFQGASRHAIGYDEEPPEDIRDENLMRLIDTDGEETFSLTPVSGALKYLYDDIFLKRSREVENDYDFVTNEKGKLIDAIKKDYKDNQIFGPDADPDIECFFYNIFDNPGISKDAAIRILSKMPAEEIIVRGKGHFLFKSGLIYKEFSDVKHVIPEFNDWWQGDSKYDYSLFIAIDPHPRTPHAVLFIVVDRKGTMYIVDELFVDCDAPDLVDMIKLKCNGKRPEAILIDPLAYAPDPSTKSNLAYDLMNYGLNDPQIIPASKNKTRGILRCRQLLAPALFDADASPRPGVYVTDNCTRFRYEITRYAWDDWKKHDRNTKGEKQDPIKKDDHLMEDWYRLVLHEPQWVDTLADLAYASDDYDYEHTGQSAITGY